MVIFAIMASTLLGLPGPLVESREAGIYRSFKINGVPALSILAIPDADHHLPRADRLGDHRPHRAPLLQGQPPTNWGAFVLITLLTALAFGAIGALIGVIAKAERDTVLLSQAIFLPSMLLGGMMMPLSMLPASVQRFSALLPTTHAMQAFQGLAFGQETVLNPTLSLLLLVSSGVIAFALALYLFNWDSRNNARRGHPLLALLAWVPYVVGLVMG